jgi:uncharacterized protein
MTRSERPLALVTGASTGIGYELAQQCAHHGFDLLIVADEAAIHGAAQELRRHGGTVEAVEADLSTAAGVCRALEALGDRPVEALLANAGRGLGKGFLDQRFEEIQRVIDTNITGTLDLVQKVGRAMRERRAGRILFTGSIAGFMPEHVPGRLQRHEGVHRLLRVRAPRRARRQWSDGDVSDARAHGYAFL